MDRIRRNERMTAMMKLLSGTPNRIFTLTSFCELFGAAKSTMSEDVDLLQQVAEAFDLGQVDTVTGAAGGVRYRPAVSREKARATIGELCLREGCWAGKRVVSREWIRQMTEPRKVESKMFRGMDYGFLWWIPHPGKKVYAAIGNSGNVIYVDPERDVAVGVASYFKPTVFDRIDFIEDVLLPAVEGGV